MGGFFMSSQAVGLVGGFFALDGLGVVRRRWLMSVQPVIDSADRELLPGELVLYMAVAENPKGILEGIVVSDQRIGVIDRGNVRWFSRSHVWEVATTSGWGGEGETLHVYGDDWELAWTQMRPSSVAQQIKHSLTDGD